MHLLFVLFDLTVIFEYGLGRLCCAICNSPFSIGTQFFSISIK